MPLRIEWLAPALSLAARSAFIVPASQSRSSASSHFAFSGRSVM